MYRFYNFTLQVEAKYISCTIITMHAVNKTMEFFTPYSNFNESHA